MAKMQWDNDLTLFAGYNTKTCTFAHDGCRSICKYVGAGQNIFWAATTASSFNITNMIIKAINVWGTESNYTRVSDLLSVPSNLLGGDAKVIGHYTVMVNEKSTHVGCAMSTFIDNIARLNLIFTCNYASTNYIGGKVYQSGVSASQCIYGRDTIFNNLCTINEPYRTN